MATAMMWLRAGWRSGCLVLSLVQIAASFAALGGRMRGPGAADRALWLQRSCQALLRRLGIRLEIHGPIPRQGLIVSNHLGYFDILLLASAVPAVFVAKREVAGWPGLGPLIRRAGTLFLDRQRTSSARRVVAKMRETLDSGIPVVFFPEGTSTDGTTVLAFHPLLFEAAVAAGCTLTSAAIRYAAAGCEEARLCYFGDDVLLPHFFRSMGYREIRATLCFSGESFPATERRAAARQAWKQVSALRTLLSGEDGGRSRGGRGELNV